MSLFQAGPEPSDESALFGSAQKAAVAELAFLDAEGLPEVRPVTPLLLDGEEVAFTLTYADAELARRLEQSPDVCLTFSDSRLALAGWRPLSVSGRLSVTRDLAGDLFCDELMHQELRKYPPGRKLANSILLRRENWWYLPRFVFRLAPTGEARAVGRRTGPDHAVLAWCAGEGFGGGLLCDTVSIAGEPLEGERVEVASLSGGELPSGPAALFFHDFSVPDLEQRTSFLARGRLDGGAAGGRFSVKSTQGRRQLGRPAGLLARWREHRALERACRTNVQKAESEAGR